MQAEMEATASMGPITVVMGKAFQPDDQIAPEKASMGPITVVMGKIVTQVGEPLAIEVLQWGPSPS